MVMSAVESRRWTAAEVRALIEQNPLQTPRYELVDGELLVTPSPGFGHQKAVALLLHLPTPYLERESLGDVITSPSDVELEEETITQPDVHVVPAAEARRVRAEGVPIRELLLTVEVLSPSSARHDRMKKRPLYQRRVPGYWIVDLDTRVVERWRPGDERPEIVAGRLEWHPADASEAFVLDLDAFFAKAWGE
jgi:Uma2 family endonuclease